LTEWAGCEAARIGDGTMGRESFEFRDTIAKREREKELHPAWRGVGCLLLVLLGLAAYAAAGWFLVANQQNGWIYLPPALYYPPYVPSFVPPGMVLRLAVALLVMVFGYGLLSFVYAVLFPIEPGETDVRLTRRSRRRRGWRSRGR
jgi:hypothetical protein